MKILRKRAHTKGKCLTPQAGMGLAVGLGVATYAAAIHAAITYVF